MSVNFELSGALHVRCMRRIKDLNSFQDAYIKECQENHRLLGNSGMELLPPEEESVEQGHAESES